VSAPQDGRQRVPQEKPLAAFGVESILVINGIEFDFNYSADSHRQESTPTRFILPKTPEMVEAYSKLGKETAIQNIVDLGIFKGGSAVLFHLLFRPRRLAAVDLSTTRVAALDAYIKEHHAEDSLLPFYGYDQADGRRLQQLIESPLDLVVDDASHSYGPSRASFNALFPCVRPGGFYVIEDWGWAHWDGWPHLPADYQKSGTLFPDQPALTNLIFELVMAAATSPQLIASVRLTFNMAIVEKGAMTVEKDTFDIGNYHVSRGHRWQPVL
jgi:SAM-dependent methyltransferase